MLSTNRISITNEDLSTSSTLATTAIAGYTVIKSEKGPTIPVRIPAGSPNKIYETFGYTSKDYPLLQEALDFNSGYDLYISSPYSTGTSGEVSSVGVAYITKKGIFQRSTPVNLTSYIESVEDDDASIEGITKISSDVTVFGKTETIKADTDTTLKTITLKTDSINKDDTLTVTINNASEKFTIVEDGSSKYFCTDWEATYPTENKIQNYYKLGSVATSNGIKIALTADNFSSSVSYTVGDVLNAFKGIITYQGANKEILKDDIYGVIYQKYPSSRKTHISIASQNKGNKIEFSVSESINPSTSVSKKIVGSLDPLGKDGYGSSIGFSTLLSNNPFIGVYTIKLMSKEDATGVWDANTFELGGSRVATELSKGWEIAKESKYSDVEIFFKSDTEACDTFFELANSHKLSRFIFSSTPETLSNLQTLTYGNQYFNICNMFLRVSAFTKDKYYSPLIGAYSLMIARILDNKYGGVAPMFLNESGMGGQLGVTTRKAKYDWDKDELDSLTNANYNPIIKDPTYGVMVVGQKTCQAGEASDWSFIGHVSAFLLYERQLYNNVMVPQLGKANNDYYRDLRKTQADAYAAQRTTGSNSIWAAAINDTSTAVNTDEVRAALHFKIHSKVKVDIFSEFVDLILTNEAQDVEIG